MDPKSALILTIISITLLCLGIWPVALPLTGIGLFFLYKTINTKANDCECEYYCIQLTKEELDEISIALKVRIDELKKTLSEVYSIEAKDVIGKTLQACIHAQMQTTYAEQPEEYLYQDEELPYQKKAQ